MPKRRKSVIETRIRLYPGQESDQALIAWLAQFDDAPYGAKQQAVKAALLRGIGEGGEPAAGSDGSGFDWTMLRRVMESVMQAKLPHIRQIGPAEQVDEPEAGSESPLVTDCIAGIMGAFNDDDD